MTVVNDPDTENLALHQDLSLETPVYWSKLETVEQAFVVAYVENNYSVADAADAIDKPRDYCRKLLNRFDVRNAIKEVEKELGDIDIMNERWVKSQLLKIWPMIIGEEESPMVTSKGEQVMLKKLYADTAVRIIEYVSPKGNKGKTSNDDETNVVVYLPDNGRQ